MTQKTALPLVSIVIPTYNRLELLKIALASAQAQTYPNLEIVLFDNASTDGTSEWLKQQAKTDKRLTIIINPYNMERKSILQTPKYIQGKYLLILCDDDLIEKTFIETAIDNLETHPTVHLWFSRTEVFTYDDQHQSHTVAYTPAPEHAGFIDGPQFATLTFARKLPVYWCSIVYRVSTLDTVAGFDTELRFLDMANNINCALQGQAFFHNEVLAYYRESHLNDTKTVLGQPMALLPHYEAMYQKICRYTGRQFETGYLRFAICCSLGHILTWGGFTNYWKSWIFLTKQGYSKFTLTILLLANLPRTLFRLIFGTSAKQRLMSCLKKALPSRNQS